MTKWMGVVAVLALLAAGISVAAGNVTRGKTAAVAASFDGPRAAARERVCTAADGRYRIAHEVYRGAVTSADARLGGAFVLRLRTVVNEANGLGTARGKVLVRGDDGRLKAKGRLAAAQTAGGELTGVVVGRVRGAGRLVANFHARLDGDAIAGELGAGSGDRTAVVQSRACPRRAR